MDNLLEPVADGLPMRETGPWVAEKLDYVRRYIDVFTTSMHAKAWRAMNYIDLFAGPGKCCVRDSETVHLGSPLLALTASDPFSGYYFVDMSPGNIDALRQRVSASPVRDRAQFLVGDSNVLVRQVVDNILAVERDRMPGKWRSSLNLAFLDPEGLELQWQTVATLSRLSRLDLIIYYPQGGLNRCMGGALEEAGEVAVDAFFGDTVWREIYRKRQAGKTTVGVHRQLMDHYRSKLAALGYREVLRDDQVGDEPLIRNSRRRAPLYRLLFASKHRLGHDFWHKVVGRDVYGQGRLL